MFSLVCITLEEHQRWGHGLEDGRFSTRMEFSRLLRTFLSSNIATYMGCTVLDLMD